MKYITLLILIITSLHTPWARGADNRYRVEVLVLKHLESVDQAKEVNRIKDYSTALDFLTPAVEEEEKVLPDGCEPLLEENEPAAPDEVVQDAATAVENTTGDRLEAETALEEEALDPNAVVHVEEMGAEMQDAWRRLRLSGPFRPIQYLAWEQGNDAPFPSLRLHDLELVFEDDPYSDLREANEELAAVYGDGIDASPNCDEPEEDTLPEPTLYYALDGTVSLVRTRFLHLNLDLQLREALFETETLPGQAPAYALPPGTGGEGKPELSQATSFLVHEFEQSRQVRSARMEYFDGPVVGVLAWITTIPLEDTAER